MQAQYALRAQLSVDEQRFDKSVSDLQKQLVTALANSAAASSQVQLPVTVTLHLGNMPPALHSDQ